MNKYFPLDVLSLHGNVFNWNFKTSLPICLFYYYNCVSVCWLILVYLSFQYLKNCRKEASQLCLLINYNLFFNWFYFYDLTFIFYYFHFIYLLFFVCIISLRTPNWVLLPKRFGLLQQKLHRPQFIWNKYKWLRYIFNVIFLSREFCVRKTIY